MFLRVIRGVKELHETLFVLLHKWIGAVGTFGLTHWSVSPDVVRTVTQGYRGCYSNSSYASELFTRRYSCRYTRGSGLLVYLVRRIEVFYHTLFSLLHKGIGVVTVFGLTYWSVSGDVICTVTQEDRGC